jgi:hypothetical protein
LISDLASHIDQFPNPVRLKTAASLCCCKMHSWAPPHDWITSSLVGYTSAKYASYCGHRLPSPAYHLFIHNFTHIASVFQPLLFGTLLLLLFYSFSGFFPAPFLNWFSYGMSFFLNIVCIPGVSRVHYWCWRMSGLGSTLMKSAFGYVTPIACINYSHCAVHQHILTCILSILIHP